jgi:hypothetical protein
MREVTIGSVVSNQAHKCMQHARIRHYVLRTTYYLLPSGTTCGAVRIATSMARTCDERKHEVTPNQLVQSDYIQ